MAQITREVLDATGMSLAIFCAGQSTVGIGLTGTWVGTASFYGSFDGVTFSALTVTPFASGTTVSSATANGNWYVNVQNYMVVKVVFTRTSGSLSVTVAAATDASWQDAFLTTAQIHNQSTVTSGRNTLTQSASTNRAWKLLALDVSIAGPPAPGGSVQLNIYDGTIAGTLLFSQYLTQDGGSVGRTYAVDIPDTGIVNTPGNAFTIDVFGTLSNQSSKINAKFSAA